METKKHFQTFDLYRAIFAIFVVAWHTHALGETELFSSTDKFSVSLVDVIYFNVFLIAVPLFFQVSLFLYVKNRKNTKEYFKKRIVNLLYLSFFWVSCWLFFITGIEPIPLKEIPIFIITGGRSIFYFFISLLLLTVVTEFILRTEKFFKPKTYLIIQWLLLLVSILVLVFKGVISNYLGEYLRLFFVPYSSPINFIPYVFVAIIINQLCKKNKISIGSKFYVVSLTIYILLSFIEWNTLPNSIYIIYDGYPFPPYERISLIFGSATLLLFAIYKDIKTPKIINYLSASSLGIYCIHYFVITKLPAMDFYKLLVNNRFLCFLVVVFITIFFTHFLKHKKVI